MNNSNSDALFILACVTSAVAVLTFLWTIYWALRVHNQVKEANNHERWNDHDRRLIKIEAALNHLPEQVASHKDVQVVHDRVTDVRKELKMVGQGVSAIEGAMAHITKAVDRLTNHQLRTD